MKRILSLVLCAVLVFGMLSLSAAAVNAADYPDVHYDCYTYLGDSMSWGYGLDPEVDNHDAHNVGVRVEGSFTDLVADVIEANNPDAVVHPAASSGARFCDFRILLEQNMGVENPYDRENDWFGNRHPDRRERLLAMGPQICRWIQESDLITLQSGLNDVAGALVNSAIATGLLDMEKISDVSLKNPSAVAAYLKTVMANLAKDPDVLGNLVRTFKSEISELRENMQAVVREVVELAPDDADILLVGYHKAVKSFRVIPDTDFSILFDLLDDTVVSINDYFETIAAEYDNVFYVDAPNASVFFPVGSTLVDVLKNTDTILGGIHPDAAGHEYIAGCVLDELQALATCRHVHTKSVVVKLGIGLEFASREVCTDCGKVVRSAVITTPIGELPIPELTFRNMMDDVRSAVIAVATRLTRNMISRLVK